MRCRRHRDERIVAIALAIITGCMWMVPVAAAPSLSIQATRRDPSGAVVFAPTITDRQGVLQPPLAVPGEYVIVTGSGFPANAPITATITDGTGSGTMVPIPLTYQDLTTNVSAPQQLPVTDSMGGINGLAFQVPPTSQFTGRRGIVAINVSGVVTGALVNLDIPDPAATSGDKLVVGAAIAFYLVIGILFVVLLRGLPTYPILRTADKAGNAR